MCSSVGVGSSSNRRRRRRRRRERGAAPVAFDNDAGSVFRVGLERRGVGVALEPTTLVAVRKPLATRVSSAFGATLVGAAGAHLAVVRPLSSHEHGTRSAVRWMWANHAMCCISIDIERAAHWIHTER
jgi:hypothetical protein